MIAKLKGVVDRVGEGHAIVDVGGVGYLVHCAARTLGRLKAGEAAALLIETDVGEDHIRLFGFADAAEQDWFRLLTSVQGVGARIGLAVLSALTPDELARAIAAQDKTALSRANGVGGKLAQRIVTELKDKVGALALGAASSPASAGKARKGDGAAGGLDQTTADAVSALVNLGYAPADALGAVATAGGALGIKAPVSELIRAALSELAATRAAAGAGGRRR
ncbi:MAG: Holliday junction branch migration protein RuvA [Alphaproteobacteria bacterium]|nr:Holliday junction branch migration protein RuvA [Alphaproteobacteria bacterium]